MGAMTRRAMLSAPAVLASAAPALAQGTTDVAKTLAEHCARLAREEDFSGTVLLARGGRPILRAAYGLANRGDGVRNRPDTKFNIASMSKMFTALAILRFVEAGRLRLGDRLIDHVPDYPNRVVAERVTIEQLLTHTSGLGNYWAALGARPDGSVDSVADLVALFAADPFEGPPGVFAYSNCGYVLLGLVIERLAGRDYFDHVRETIFRPLGMSATGNWRLDEVIPGRAEGYTRDLERPGVWRSNIFADIARGSPAGGAYATADDLLVFANALQAGRLLGPEMTRAWTQGRFPYAHGRYGYGMSEAVVAGHRIVGHSGGHIGIAGELMIFEDLGYTLVILTNGEVDGFWDVSNFAKRLLAGENEAVADYAFTRGLVDTIFRDGAAAGDAAYRARPAGRVAKEGVIDVLAMKALHRGRPDAAMALLRFNVRTFPESADALWQLGEGARIAGRRDEALQAYRAYLARNPGDADATKRIADLERQGRP